MAVAIGSNTEKAPVLSPDATASRMFEMLYRAKQAVELAQARDAQFPELGELLPQGSSLDYTTYNEQPWQPFTRTAIINIPDAIFEHYNSTQVETHMGLFHEIQHAYITVDNKLYLWNFMKGDDFAAFEDNQHTITHVKLLKPRSGVFIPSINYLLAVVTPFQVFLLGVKFDGTLSFYRTDMSTSVRDIEVAVVDATEDGRIILGSKDGNIYEIVYNSQESWFTSKCWRLCHTISGLNYILPSFLHSSSSESLVSLAIDNSRSLLYVLMSKGTIRAYHLQRKNIITHLLDYKYSQMMSHAQMMHAGSLNARDFTVVSISPITISMSSQILLLATTSSGLRLYLRAVRSFGFPAAPASALQIAHIRFPPQQHGAPSPVVQSYNFGSHYFAFSRNSGSFYAAALDSPRIALQQLTLKRAEIHEIVANVPIEGFVQDMVPMSEKLMVRNEMTVSFQEGSQDYAVLTNTGIHIVHRRLLPEILVSALKENVPQTDLEKLFFEHIGRAESCAVTLAVACGKAGLYRVPTSISLGRSSFGISAQEVDISEIAKRYYIEVGGKAMLDDRFTASLDSVRLSGRFDGLATYLARLLLPIWNTKVVKEVKNKQQTTYVSRVPFGTLQSILSDLNLLYDFLEINRPLIEGLAGELNWAGQSKNEEVALQAEHHGMNSLLTLTNYAREVIQFVLILDDEYLRKLNGALEGLTPEDRKKCLELTYGTLCTTPEARKLAKELVNAVVNREIKLGVGVDAIVEALQKHCSSFCSGDDVIMYRAIGHLRNARDTHSMEQLRESKILFEQAASSMTLDNLLDTMNEYCNQKYYDGKKFKSF